MRVTSLTSESFVAGNAVLVGFVPKSERRRHYLCFKVGILDGSSDGKHVGVFFPNGNGENEWSTRMAVNEDLLIVCE